MELLERLKILNNHLQGKNYNKVIEGCNKVLKANPNIPYALNLCGLAQQGKNNFLLSISFFTRAINLEPRNIAAINNLANSYKFLTKIDLAEKLYLKALALDPNYIQALNNYGNLKQQIGDFDSSIELYLKALNINSKQKNIMFSLASAYQELGNFEKSKETFSIIDSVSLPFTWAYPVTPGIKVSIPFSFLNKTKSVWLKRAGLGPTRVISPFKIENSCGSSSRLVRRKKPPKGNK